MSLVPTPMSAAVERTVAVATGAVATGAIAVRRIFRRGQKHLPQRKRRNAGEYQQKHAKMHPTGRVHVGLLPRLERQILSTERT